MEFENAVGCSINSGTRALGKTATAIPISGDRRESVAWPDDYDNAGRVRSFDSDGTAVPSADVTCF